MLKIINSCLQTFFFVKKFENKRNDFFNSAKFFVVVFKSCNIRWAQCTQKPSIFLLYITTLILVFVISVGQSILFKGTDQLCKVVKLSMQCCGQIHFLCVFFGQIFFSQKFSFELYFIISQNCNHYINPISIRLFLTNVAWRGGGVFHPPKILPLDLR